MKSKLLLLIMLLAGISQSHAYVIIRSGTGGVNGGYYYVNIDRYRIICTCIGNRMCPVGEVVLASPTGKTYSTAEITETVDKLVSAGQTEGSMNYNDDLPVKWMINDGKLEIHTEEKDVITDPPLEELQKKYNTAEVCEK